MEKKHSHIIYGLVTGAVICLLGLILHLTGLTIKPNLQWLQYLQYIPFFVGLVMNADAFAKSKDNFVTYGMIFSTCFKTTIIITLISIAWAFISLSIFPDMKEKALEVAKQKMYENQKMTEEQIDMAFNMTKKFFNVFMIAGILVMDLVYGLVLSLIAAAIPKKLTIPPFTNTNSQ